MPSAAIRNGDFSNALNANGTLQRIYDPFSGDQATGTGRVQFDNNIIPVSRMNAISRRLQDLYPLPNVEGTGAGGFTNNYRTTRHANTDRHNYDAKVNWNRTSSHQLWGKYSHMNAVVDDLFTFPLGSSDDDGCDTKVHLITGGQTWSFGRSLLLDSAVGVSIMDQFCSSADFGLGMLGLDYGIPGTNDQGRSDPRYAGMPEFRTGFQALGNSPTPTYRDEGTTSSAATSRRSRPTTSSDSGIVSTTCTWTTGSRNGPTRADDSISPAMPRGRSAPARRRRTSTTPTRRSCSASSARRARAISMSCSPGASGSTRCMPATAGR